MKNSIVLVYLFSLSILFSCTKKQEEETVTTQPETNTEQANEDASASGQNVVGEEIAYSADGVEMKGYIAYDASKKGKRPGVLVIHEWWGHNDYARKRADMLAELGYVALAVDMYGDGKQAAHPEDAGKFAGAVMQNIEGATARFNQALATLKANENTDAEKIAAIGYCFGGSVALTMANLGADLDGVAAFHSGVGLPAYPEAEGEVKAKILVCNGAADKFIAPEQIETFKQKMEAAKVDYKYVAYEGVLHSYTNPDADKMAEKFGMDIAYDEEADKKSWEEMQALFAEVF